MRASGRRKPAVRLAGATLVVAPVVGGRGCVNRATTRVAPTHLDRPIGAIAKAQLSACASPSQRRLADHFPAQMPCALTPCHVPEPEFPLNRPVPLAFRLPAAMRTRVTPF